MEARKKFKPFDKVLVKRDWCQKWTCDIYSHYNKNDKKPYHTTLTFMEVVDDYILPYEGNEELVGTTNEPEPEIRFEEGEWIMVGNIANSIMPEDWHIRGFHSVNSQDQIKIYNNSSCEFHHWKYAIRFRDFDPSNMEETRKHILCVKNGRIIRYKD